MQNSFDERAATWDDPQKAARARDAAASVRDAVGPGPTTRLLEYGAGTGLFAEAIRDDVGPITLAEPSVGMREVLRAKVDDGRLAGARIWELDLAHDPVPDESFDLIVALMSLHHIPELDRVLRGIEGLLEDDGALCIIDLDRDDAGSFHEPDFEGHHGFDRNELATRLAVAGFADTRFEHCHTITKDTGTYDVFLATCRKAPVGGVPHEASKPDAGA